MNITMFGRTRRVMSKYWIAIKLSICKILTSTGSCLYWKKRASLINRKCVTLAWQSKTTHCKTHLGKDFGSEYESFTVFTLFFFYFDSPDLHIFNSIQYFLGGKRYTDYEKVKKDIKVFLREECYGIDNLPVRWDYVI